MSRKNLGFVGMLVAASILWISPAIGQRVPAKKHKAEVIPARIEEVQIDNRIYNKIFMTKEKLTKKFGPGLDLERYRGYFLQEKSISLEGLAADFRSKQGVTSVEIQNKNMIRVYCPLSDVNIVFGPKTLNPEDGQYQGYIDIPIPKPAPLLPYVLPFPKDLPEIESQRTEFSRSFLNPDGTVSTFLSVRPTGYKTTSGQGEQWIDILPEDPVPALVLDQNDLGIGYYAYCVEKDNDNSSAFNFVSNSGESYYSVIGSGEDTGIDIHNHLYQRNALQFPTSGIPSGALISNLEFEIRISASYPADVDISDEVSYQYNDIWPYINHLSEKPQDYFVSSGSGSDMTTDTLYDDCWDGARFWDGGGYAWSVNSGYVTAVLNSSCISDFQSNFDRGWYAFGVVDKDENNQNPTYWQGIAPLHFYDTLRVDYTVPQCHIVLNPSDHTFLNTYPDHVSSWYQFTLQNTGDASAVGYISLDSNSNFEIQSGDGGLYTLAPDGEININVRFTPGQTGSYGDVLRVTSSCNEAVSYVYGTCDPEPVCELELSTSEHNFDEILVGECSAYFSFTLTNNGNTAASGNIGLSSGQHFSINPSDAGSFSLQAGSSKIIHAQFCPQATGGLGDQLEVTGSGICNSLTASLTGVGLAQNCDLSLSTYSHDFGSVEEGSCSNSYSIVLDNNGNVQANGTISLSSSVNFQFDSGSGSFSLPGGESRTIEVRFCPNNTGQLSTQLLVTGSGICNSPSANLSGTGTLPSVCQLEVDSSSIPNPVPSGGGTYTLSVHNSGTSTCSWSMNPSCNWISTGSNPNPLAPGYTVQVDFVIDPNPLQSDRACTVVFQANDCEPINVYVNQLGGDPGIRVGNLKITGESINGSTPNYTISNNIQIGYYGEDFLLRWPSTTVTAIVNTATQTINFTSGFNTFEAVTNCGIAFTASQLDFDCATGTASFSGDVAFGGLNILSGVSNAEIDFDDLEFDLLGGVFDFPGELGIVTPSCQINLANSVASIGVTAGDCYELGPLAIDTQTEAAVIYDVCEQAVGFDLDLTAFEMGKKDDNPLSCIDTDSWVFSPVDGPQLHVRYDIDDHQIQFPQRSGIAIPLPVAMKVMSEEEIDQCYMDGRVIERADGRAFVVLGIYIEGGSYIDFDTWDFNMVMDLNVNVAGQDLTIDNITAQYDAENCEFTGGVGIGLDIIEDLLSTSGYGQFTFGGCSIDDGVYHYGIASEFHLDLAWVINLMLQATLDFWNNGSISSSFISGVLDASMDVLGWEFGTGINFQVYPDRFVIGDLEIQTDDGPDRVGSGEVWTLTREGVEGYYKNGFQFGGFIDVPPYTEFNVDPDEYDGRNQAPKRSLVDRFGIPMPLEVVDGVDPALGHVDGVYISNGSSQTIRLEGSDGWFVELNYDGIMTNNQNDANINYWDTEDGRRVLHIWSTASRSLPDQLDLLLSGISGDETLALDYVVGGQGGTRGDIKVVNYDEDPIESGQTLSTTIDLSNPNNIAMVQGAAAPINFEALVTQESSTTGLAIGSFNSNWVGNPANLTIQVVTNQDAHCQILYGSEVLTESSDLSPLSTSHSFTFSEDQIQPGDIFKVVAMDADLHLSVYSPIAVVPIAGSGADCLSMSLNQGWNYVSSNIVPVDLDILTFLNPVLDDVNLVKQCNGDFALPGIINTLDPWEYSSAYWIHMAQPRSFTYCGAPVDPSTPIDLGEGWNCVSYLCTGNQDAQVALAGIESCLNICKAPDGTFYLPGIINSIGDMMPGEGYQMNLECASQLVYDCTGASQAVAKSRSDAGPSNVHFLQVPRTQDFHPIIVRKSSRLKFGDEIGFFNEDGNIVGSAVFVGEDLATAVWADDEQTDAVDGCQSGEKIGIKVWQKEAGNEFSPEINILAGTMSFGESDYTIVELSKPEHITGNQQFTCSPNPFNPRTTISFDLPESRLVRLCVYNTAGRLVRELVNETLPAGRQEYVWDGRDAQSARVASGMYLCRLMVGDDIVVKKVVLAK